MKKKTSMLHLLVLSFVALAVVACDADADPGDAIPRDATILGAIEADGLPEEEVQALALAAAFEEAGVAVDPPLVHSTDLVTEAPDPDLACSGWIVRCCTYDHVRCCADLIGDYWCQY